MVKESFSKKVIFELIPMEIESASHAKAGRKHSRQRELARIMGLLQEKGWCVQRIESLAGAE